MAFCNNCGSQLPEGATFCSNCGTPVGQVNPAVQTVFDPNDHTAEYDAADIASNKVFAMAAYLLGVPGIIIALLAAKDSAYTGFHCRQALKFSIVKLLLTVIIALLCWTVIVPIAGGICILVLEVIEIICFFQVCSGKAKDAAIIRSFGFLK